MSKNPPRYQCRECAALLSKWAGQCPECRQWNSIEELSAPGGFSNAEYELATESGFEAVSMGPRILRTETAAAAVLAALQAIYGDLA